MHYYYYLFDLRDTSANHNQLTSDNINLHHIPVQSTSQEFSRGGLLTEQEARLVLGLSIGYMDRQFPAFFFPFTNRKLVLIQSLVYLYWCSLLFNQLWQYSDPTPEKKSMFGEYFFPPFSYVSSVFMFLIVGVAFLQTLHLQLGSSWCGAVRTSPGW